MDLDLDPNPGLFFSLLSIEMYGKLPILELNRIAQKLWNFLCILGLILCYQNLPCCISRLIDGVCVLLI